MRLGDIRASSRSSLKRVTGKRREGLAVASFRVSERVPENIKRAGKRERSFPVKLYTRRAILRTQSNFPLSGGLSGLKRGEDVAGNSARRSLSFSRRRGNEKLPGIVSGPIKSRQCPDYTAARLGNPLEEKAPLLRAVEPRTATRDNVITCGVPRQR